MDFESTIISFALFLIDSVFFTNRYRRRDAISLSRIIFNIYFFLSFIFICFLCYNQLGESYHIGPLGAHAASLVAEEPERVHVAV